MKTIFILKWGKYGLKKKKKQNSAARALIVDSDDLQFPSFFCSGPKPLLIWLSERPVGKKGFTGNGNMSRGLVHTTVSVPGANPVTLE